MKRKMYWGIALLAIMAVTVGCGSDDEEMDSRVANFVESTSYTEEMLTGFEPLGIQGEWIDTAYLVEGDADNIGKNNITELLVSLFFNDQGKVRVVVSNKDAFFLPSGVYDYRYDAEQQRLYINDKPYVCWIYGGIIHIQEENDKWGKMFVLSRESNSENAVPAFFEQFTNGRLLPQPDFKATEWTVSLYIINSLTELDEVYQGDVQLPPIDFNQYTLLFGCVYVPTKDMEPVGMELRQDDEKCVFHIDVVNNAQGTYGYGPWEYPYWRLYPKLSAEEIEVEVEMTTAY